MVQLSSEHLCETVTCVFSIFSQAEVYPFFLNDIAEHYSPSIENVFRISTILRKKTILLKAYNLNMNCKSALYICIDIIHSFQHQRKQENASSQFYFLCWNPVWLSRSSYQFWKGSVGSLIWRINSVSPYTDAAWLADCLQYFCFCFGFPPLQQLFPFSFLSGSKILRVTISKNGWGIINTYFLFNRSV